MRKRQVVIGVLAGVGALTAGSVGSAAANEVRDTVCPPGASPYYCLPTGPLPPGPLPPGPSDTTPPGVSSFGVTNSPFAVGNSSTPLFANSAAKRHKKGTTIRYTLSEAATAKIVISQRRSGRRKGIRCVAPRRSLRKKAKCTRFIRKATLTRVSHQGVNRVAFSGRIRGKALSPGSYSATITATDPAKNTSGPKTISFTIVKR